MLTSTFNKMLIQYGYTKMKCGNIFKQMKSFLEFKTMSGPMKRLRGERRPEIHNHLTLSRRFDFGLFQKVFGPRYLSKPTEKLRLIRNAISHARVVIDDDNFCFSDKSKNEEQETVLKGTWASVGMLA